MNRQSQCKIIKKFAYSGIKALLLFAIFTTSYADSPYSWYTFNIPPFGSVDGQGIGYVLAHSYIEAGLKNKIVLTNPARWFKEMQDASNTEFCTTGSWKVPKTNHRVYSNSILNTVDYGVAVRPTLYKKLTNSGKLRTVSISDVISSTITSGQMLILNGRPVFGEMHKIIEKRKNEVNTKIEYMTASEGPVSLLRIANTANRNVDSALIFPEEFTIFANEYPYHSLKYLTLSEGTSFAPIRASCPDTESGRFIISKINDLLDDGLRERAFALFLKALPDIFEIKRQARINQLCIKDHSCKDPLID
mgnify:FL=1